MINKLKIIITLFSLLLLFTALVFADVPQLINFQGRLLPPGSYTLIFELLKNNPISGIVLYTEENVNIQTDINGIFNYNIGSLNPIPPDTFLNQPIYLRVINQATGLPISICTLVTVPYAFVSQFSSTAYMLNGKDSAYFLDVSTNPQTKEGSFTLGNDLTVGNNLRINSNNILGSDGITRLTIGEITVIYSTVMIQGNLDVQGKITGDGSGLTDIVPVLSKDVVGSYHIVDSTITNADISSNANIDWSKINKAGSSLADLSTKSAGDLTSGTLDDARLSNNVTKLGSSIGPDEIESGDYFNDVKVSSSIYADRAGNVTLGKDSVGTYQIIDSTITNDDLAGGIYDKITGVGTLNSLSVSGNAGIGVNPGNDRLYVKTSATSGNAGHFEIYQAAAPDPVILANKTSPPSSPVEGTIMELKAKDQTKFVVDVSGDVGIGAIVPSGLQIQSAVSETLRGIKILD